MVQSEVIDLFFGVSLYVSGCDNKTDGDGAKVKPLNTKAALVGQLLYVQSFVVATTYSRPYGLPSALQRLTSVFGMGTGGSIASSHHNKEFNSIVDNFIL